MEELQITRARHAICLHDVSTGQFPTSNSHFEILSFQRPWCPDQGTAAHSFLIFCQCYSFFGFARTMVDSRCHSFEEASSTANYHHQMTQTPTSRSEPSQDNGSLRLTDFATINLPLLETPASS